MGKIKILFLMAFILLMGSCENLSLEDDELTLNQMPHTGDQIRTDGYYYLLDKITNTISATYFLFENGVLLHGGGSPYKNGFAEIESNFRSEDWQEKIKNNKLKWGLFQVEVNEISFERWYPSSGGPNPVFTRSGQILNDTTFLITTAVRPKTGEKMELNEVYYFKEFSPKPDSTNRFIE